MAEEINFIDLACLLQITPDTTLEKFAGAINGAFFDASNLAGTLKQKQLIDFNSYYPGPNTIVVSDTGKALLAEAEAKVAEPYDDLDSEILFQVSGGKRIPAELQNTLNIRPKDLALRLFKLSKQNFLIYELKNGTASVQLTESGFLKAKEAQASKVPVTAQPKPQPPPPPTTPPEAPHTEQMAPKSNNKMYAAAGVVIVIAAILGYLFINKII